MNAITHFATFVRNNGLQGTLSAGTQFLLQGGLTYSPDITPDPLDWGDVSYVRGQIPQNNIAQVDGIDVPITLRLEWSGTAGTVLYKVSSTSFNQFDYGVFPADWTTLTSGSTFVADGKQYVGFVRTATKAGSILFTVRNASDGDTILDTFTLTLT